MIKNEKQYKMAKTKLDKWLQTQAQLRKNTSVAKDDWLTKEQAFGVKQQIKQLKAEITEYEETVSGTKQLPDLGLVNDIPQLLISWRIARHLTQRDLADRLGIHENQIQKYEAENYSGASLLTVTHIAQILKEESSVNM